MLHQYSTYLLNPIADKGCTLWAVWVKSTDSGYLVTVDFSLFLPRTSCWNLSTIENYKFDLRSFHQGELRPLTEVIKCPHNCKHLTTYIIYLLHTVFFTILEQGLTRKNTTFIYTELPYPVGNKQLFTSPQLHAWITKTSAQRAASHQNQRGSFHILMMHFCNVLRFMQCNWDVP